MHPEWIYRNFVRLTRKADLPALRLHELRHTHATHALAAGSSLKVIQDRLGHRSYTLTANTYTHMLLEVDRAAAEATAKLAFPEAALANREQVGQPPGEREQSVDASSQVDTGAPRGT